MKRFDFADFPPLLFIGSIFFALVLAIATNLVRNFTPAQLVDLELNTETGAILTETGSIAKEDRQLTPEERDARINGFMLRVDNRFEKIQSQRNAQQLRYQESIQHQILCRDDARRSNRDTKLPTLFRCYRGALTLDLESLRKEYTNINDLTGATTETREANLADINELMDAIATIIDAIDVDVYGSEEDLEEAKRNLAERYWTPKWLSSTKLRADEMLTWTAFMMSETAPIVLKEDLREGEQEIYTNAYACLEDAELRLTAVIDAEELDMASEKMDGALNELSNCLDIINTKFPSQSEPKQEPEDQIEEPKSAIEPDPLPRRVRRHIQ